MNLSIIKKLLILTLTSITLIINIQSQSVQPASDNATMLTGHLKKEQQVIMGVKDIVVGHFTVLGYPSSDASGENFYEQAEIEVDYPLEGSLGGKHRAGYTVLTVPGKDREVPPVIKTQYIMFIQKLGPNEFEVKKLLPATDENIARIKALVASSQATQ